MRYTACLVIVLAMTLSGVAGCDLLVSPETRIERATAMIDGGEYRKAVFELRKVLEDEPAHARARLLLAQAEIFLGGRRVEAEAEPHVGERERGAGAAAGHPAGHRDVLVGPAGEAAEAADVEEAGGGAVGGGERPAPRWSNRMTRKARGSK